MTLKTFCDICEKEAKRVFRVNWRYQYCEECYRDKKNWVRIHKETQADEA